MFTSVTGQLGPRQVGPIRDLSAPGGGPQQRGAYLFTKIYRVSRGSWNLQLKLDQYTSRPTHKQLTRKQNTACICVMIRFIIQYWVTVMQFNMRQYAT